MERMNGREIPSYRYSTQIIFHEFFCVHWGKELKAFDIFHFLGNQLLHTPPWTNGNLFNNERIIRHSSCCFYNKYLLFFFLLLTDHIKRNENFLGWEPRCFELGFLSMWAQRLILFRSLSADISWWIDLKSVYIKAWGVQVPNVFSRYQQNLSGALLRYRYRFHKLSFLCSRQAVGKWIKFTLTWMTYKVFSRETSKWQARRKTIKDLFVKIISCVDREVYVQQAANAAMQWKMKTKWFQATGRWMNILASFQSCFCPPCLMWPCSFQWKRKLESLAWAADIVIKAKLIISCHPSFFNIIRFFRFSLDG